MMPIKVLIDLGSLFRIFRVPVIGCSSRFMKISEDCMALKKVNLAVLVANGWHFGIGVDLFKFRFVLVHIHDSHFLEFEGDLVDL
jgi:hypothetical protein